MLEFGRGVAVDRREAVRLFRKAAWLGHTGAMSNFGRCVHFGVGSSVRRDVVEARRWYTLAAEAGDARAQYALAMIYDEGWGPEDVLAAMPFEKVRGGKSGSRPLPAGGPTAAIIPVDTPQAVRYYAMAVRQNHPGSQHRMAALYHYGSSDGYVEVDLAKALELYRCAADQGHAVAQPAAACVLEEDVAVAGSATAAGSAGGSNALLSQKEAAIEAARYFIMAVDNDVVESRYAPPPRSIYI
jgi:TPR repeat protein